MAGGDEIRNLLSLAQPQKLIQKCSARFLIMTLSFEWPNQKGLVWGWWNCLRLLRIQNVMHGILPGVSTPSIPLMMLLPLPRLIGFVYPWGFGSRIECDIPRELPDYKHTYLVIWHSSHHMFQPINQLPPGLIWTMIRFHFLTSFVFHSFPWGWITAHVSTY